MRDRMQEAFSKAWLPLDSQTTKSLARFWCMGTSEVSGLTHPWETKKPTKIQTVKPFYNIKKNPIRACL